MSTLCVAPRVAPHVGLNYCKGTPSVHTFWDGFWGSFFLRLLTSFLALFFLLFSLSCTCFSHGSLTLWTLGIFETAELACPFISLTFRVYSPLMCPNSLFSVLPWSCAYFHYNIPSQCSTQWYAGLLNKLHTNREERTHLSLLCLPSTKNRTWAMVSAKRCWTNATSQRLKNGKDPLVLKSIPIQKVLPLALNGSVLHKKFSQSYMEQAHEKCHTKCLLSAHIYPDEQTVTITDRAGPEAVHRCDILPRRGDQHPVQITTGRLRVINEVRGNRKAR
jgi:hypothetical protein